MSLEQAPHVYALAYWKPRSGAVRWELWGKASRTSPASLEFEGEGALPYYAQGCAALVRVQVASWANVPDEAVAVLEDDDAS